MSQFKLMTIKNHKTCKGESSGYLTLILHLAPANTSGYEVCPHSSPACREVCLNHSGHGRYERAKEARRRRTRLWFEAREAFKFLIVEDINTLLRKCARENMRPAVRMNGTSDIDWVKEWPELFAMFPQVQFYDYTKDRKRLEPYRTNPVNYHLTFSRSELTPLRTVKSCLKHGHNVAVVFATLPPTWQGMIVTSGDDSDLRFLDPPGITGLSPKGRAIRHKRTSFVVR